MHTWATITARSSSCGVTCDATWALGWSSVCFARSLNCTHKMHWLSVQYVHVCHTLQKIMQFSQATDNMDAKQNTNLVPEDQELTTRIVSPWICVQKEDGWLHKSSKWWNCPQVTEAGQQGVYKSSLTNFQVISRDIQDAFSKFHKIFMLQAIQYQNAGEVCNVYKWACDDELRSTLIIVPEIIVILFTRGLPYVQCTKNRLTCENYTANYKLV